MVWLPLQKFVRSHDDLFILQANSVELADHFQSGGLTISLLKSRRASGRLCNNHLARKVLVSRITPVAPMQSSSHRPRRQEEGGVMRRNYLLLTLVVSTSVVSVTAGDHYVYNRQLSLVCTGQLSSTFAGVFPNETARSFHYSANGNESSII